MKRVLQWIMFVLIVLAAGGYLATEHTQLMNADLFLTIAVLLLVVVFSIYYSRYGGTRCPNCNFRINAKHTKYKDYNGRIPCPKCGETIEV